MPNSKLQCRHTTTHFKRSNNLNDHQQ